jgi:tetratricopeptide (TPR) repeat protein
VRIIMSQGIRKPMQWMVIAGVIAVAAPAAWGQSDVDAARASAERGRREYNLGHWQQSIEAFEKAYQVTGDAALLFNLGQAHRQIGHVGEALRLYRAYLRDKPDAPNREVAERQLKELEAQEARAPAAAQRPLAPSAKPASAPTGSFVQRPSTAPPSSAAPAAASTTAPPPPTAATTSPGAVITVPASPPRRHTPLPRWLPLVGAGLAIASSAAAVVVGLQASNRYDYLRATCGQTAAGCAADQVDGVRSRDRAATILWVSAGVLATATGVTIVVNTHAAGASALWRF